jgi:hypothetical protein
MKAKKTRKPVPQPSTMILNIMIVTEAMIGDPERWAQLNSDSVIPDNVEETGLGTMSSEDDIVVKRSASLGELMAEWPILHAMWLNLRALYVIYKSCGDAYDVNFLQWLITRKGNESLRQGITELLTRKGEGLYVHADRMLMLEIALGNDI